MCPNIEKHSKSHINCIYIYQTKLTSLLAVFLSSIFRHAFPAKRARILIMSHGYPDIPIHFFF